MRHTYTNALIKESQCHLLLRECTLQP